MSSWPSAARAAAMTRAGASASAKSASMCPTPSSSAMPNVPPGSAPQACPASCGVQPWTNTVAPASCSLRTIAKPMPARRLTPVTSAFFPAMSISPSLTRGQTRVRPRNESRTASLRGQDADDLAHGLRRCAQRLLLLVGEVELEDLFDPAGAELHGHAHVEA